MNRYNNRKYLDINLMESLDEMLLQELVIARNSNAITLKDFKDMLSIKPDPKHSDDDQLITYQKYFFKKYNWKNKSSLKALLEILQELDKITLDVEKAHIMFRRLFSAAQWRYDKMPGKNKEDIFEPYSTNDANIKFYSQQKEVLAKSDKEFKSAGRKAFDYMSSLIKQHNAKKIDDYAMENKMQNIIRELGFNENNCSKEKENRFIELECKNPPLNMTEEQINKYVRPIFRKFRMVAAGKTAASATGRAVTSTMNNIGRGIKNLGQRIGTNLPGATVQPQ